MSLLKSLKRIMRIGVGFFIALFLISFLNSLVTSLYASEEMAEFICEVGLSRYKKGDITDALHEFRKALLIEPGYEPAQRYIEMIKQEQSSQGEEAGAEKPYTGQESFERNFPDQFKPAVSQKSDKTEIIEKAVITSSASQAVPVSEAEVVEPETRSAIMENTLLDMDKPRVVEEPEVSQPLAGLSPLEKEEYASIAPQEKPAISAAPEKGSASVKSTAVPGLLILDESIKTLKFPLELEKDKSVVIRGREIKRFLSTQADILSVEKLNGNEILVTAKQYGYTYLHIWDEQQRWSLEFLVVPPKPVGPTLEEEMRKSEETAKNVKLRYALDYQSFQTGRRLDSLKRNSYSLTQSIGLVGNPETPYGNLIFDLSVDASQSSTDLSYLSLGLANGKLGPFNGFNIYAVDYTPVIRNMAFSGVNLRGAMLNSPAFDKKIDYTLFWGREGGGKFGGLSPSLVEVRDSFLSGLDVNYFPDPAKGERYGASIFHGWGSERDPSLNAYGYDLNTEHNFKNWGWKYETANDSQHFANSLNTRFHYRKVNLSTEIRDVDKEFVSMTGMGYRAGELGILNNFTYNPFETLIITSRLDLFRDRLFPNSLHPSRYNEDFDLNSSYQINNLTSLSTYFSLQNDLGRLSPFRSYTTGMGLSRVFDWVRKINTNINYTYTRNENFSSHSLDYESNRIFAGLRFSLIGPLYYFLTGQVNFVKALAVEESAHPHYYETGMEWNSQIFKSPFYANLRVSYHDEQNALSQFSFMSGEDYLESFTELSYRPKPSTQMFVNARLRNVWAENPGVSKHVDLNFYFGMRYFWDTGLHWESVGTVEGYVFNDLSTDGLLQQGELPVEGVKLWLGKDKFQVTDKNGFYSFKKVRARKAYVNIDTTTIPSGFTLTNPATQEAAIVHGKKVELNFGVCTRTEISGVIFLDLNGNGMQDSDELAVSGVVLSLENGKKATSDSGGRYIFRRLLEGKHKLSLDLKSLPSIYLPTVPIFKEFELSEGMSYTHNIPVKRIK